MLKVTAAKKGSDVPEITLIEGKNGLRVPKLTLVEAKKEFELPKELKEAAYMIGGGALAEAITKRREEIAAKEKMLKEAEEISETEPQAEQFTSENVNLEYELMIDEADVKTILDEWLLVAVRCDEKDAAALQNKCADELYSFVVNHLTTNAELEDVFTDMTMRQIHMVAASIAKELFGGNRELYKIIKDTDDIVEQFKEALLIYGASIDTNKTILEEWLLKAVQCDEKDAAMLQNQCAEELYTFVVNNLMTDDELAEVFADMTAYQIRAATAYIAKELFGMNMELHSNIVMNTDGIVEQFEKALLIYGDVSTGNIRLFRKTVFDKLVDASRNDDAARCLDKDTVYHFINSIILYIAANANDEDGTVHDVVMSEPVFQLVGCAKWMVEQVFCGSIRVIEVIESYTDATEQLKALYEKYIDEVHTSHGEVDIDMSLIHSSYAKLLSAISNAKSETPLPKAFEALKFWK